MNPGILDNWEAAVLAQNLTINWREPENASESFEFDAGADKFELVMSAGQDGPVLYLVHGMTFPLPTTRGLMLAIAFNSSLGEDAIRIDHDELCVIHTVVAAPLVASEYALGNHLLHAMEWSRFIRDAYVLAATTVQNPDLSGTMQAPQWPLWVTGGVLP